MKIRNQNKRNKESRNLNSGANGSGQIANTDYGICIQPKVGYCDLTWTTSEAHGNDAFSTSGDSSDSNNLRMDFGVNVCGRDSVRIPGGKFPDENNARVYMESFCGGKFPSQVITDAQPYVLYVKTDGDESGDNQNRGFSLNFRQNLC